MYLVVCSSGQAARCPWPTTIRPWFYCRQTSWCWIISSSGHAQAIVEYLDVGGCDPNYFTYHKGTCVHWFNAGSCCCLGCQLVWTQKWFSLRIKTDYQTMYALGLIKIYPEKIEKTSGVWIHRKHHILWISEDYNTTENLHPYVIITGSDGCFSFISFISVAVNRGRPMVNKEKTSWHHDCVII